MRIENCQLTILNWLLFCLLQIGYGASDIGDWLVLQYNTGGGECVPVGVLVFKTSGRRR